MPLVYRVYEGLGRSYVLYSTGRNRIDDHLTGDDISVRTGIPKHPYETWPACGSLWRRSVFFFWCGVVLFVLAIGRAVSMARRR